MSGCTITLTGNLWARVQGGPRVLRLVDDALTFRPKGYVFSPAYKNGFWDGTIHLLRRDRFPAGLVEHVANAVKLGGYAAEIQDTRTRPGQTAGLFPEPPQVKLKKYQEKAVEAACKAGRGVVHHPVGAGKSIVLLEIVRRLNVPTLALVHRKDLLYQLADTARRMFGMGTGIIGDGHWEDGAPLTVATFQSLYSRLKGYDAVETRAWLKRFQAVHIDECQHIEAATYEKVLSHLPKAYYRFAYSATPFRSGDKGTFLRVVGWTGPVIHRLATEKGIKAGRLVPADIFIVTPTPGARPRDTDYQSAINTGIVKHEGRNKLTIRLARALGKTGLVLILTERLEHGKILAQQLRDAGYEETV